MAFLPIVLYHAEFYFIFYLMIYFNDCSVINSRLFLSRYLKRQEPSDWLRAVRGDGSTVVKWRKQFVHMMFWISPAALEAALSEKDAQI